MFGGGYNHLKNEQRISGINMLHMKKQGMIYK